MIKQRVRVRSVTNVADSSTALVELPCGPRYHGVFLNYVDDSATTAPTIADTITEIRVKVNGRVQRTMSGTQLNAIYNGYGTDYAPFLVGTKTAVIPIHFAEPWRKDPRDQDALAWPSAGWASLQVEVDLPATNAGLTVFAVQDNFVPQNAPGIVKWIRQTFAGGGTTMDITTLDRRDWLQQLTIWNGSTTGVVDRVTVKKDGIVLHDLSKADNLGLLKNYGMNPATTDGFYDLVFDHDDLLGSAVPLEGTRDLLLSLEAASTAFAGNVVTMLQRLGPPE